MPANDPGAAPVAAMFEVGADRTDTEQLFIFTEKRPPVTDMAFRSICGTIFCHAAWGVKKSWKDPIFPLSF